MNSSDVKAALAQVEPPFPFYQRTLVALQHYMELARQDNGGQLPVPPKTLEAGSAYNGAARLAVLLRLFGDLPADAVVPAGDLYQPPLVDAVKHFQERHGLTADGRLGAQTVKELNTPLNARVEQLRLTLERWRWLPHEFPLPPVVVNVPEFRLRAFDANGKLALTSNVIVGKALRHETPVFDRDMQYVVFRPYWNVPRSIQRSEIVPAIMRDRSYIATRNYEVTTQSGKLVNFGRHRRRGTRTAARRQTRGPPEAGPQKRTGTGQVDLPQRIQRVPAQHAGAAAVRAQPARLQPWLYTR